MAQVKVLKKFTTGRHKHSACINAALTVAEHACREKGNRLTPIRRRVLELIWDNHQPVKAYDILQSLQAEQKGTAPMTVYRALEFLLKEGFVHRIESLNAYTGCGKPGHSQSGQFLICHHCGEIAELGDLELATLISEKANQLGFSIENQIVEIKGRCSRCRSKL